MGQTYSSLIKYLFTKPEKNILLYGLHSAGKTAVFNKMHLHEISYPMPMVDYCEGFLDMKNTRFYILDISRRLTSQCKDNYFLHKCDAVIFVVDSTDLDSINEVNAVLNDMISSEALKDTIFIIFANKQDLPNALDTTQVAEKIEENQRNRISHIQGTSGSTGEGVLEGMEYLNLFFSTKKWFG